MRTQSWAFSAIALTVLAAGIAVVLRITVPTCPSYQNGGHAAAVAAERRECLR